MNNNPAWNIIILLNDWKKRCWSSGQSHFLDRLITLCIATYKKDPGKRSVHFLAYVFWWGKNLIKTQPEIEEGLNWTCSMSTSDSLSLNHQGSDEGVYLENLCKFLLAHMLRFQRSVTTLGSIKFVTLILQ